MKSLSHVRLFVISWTVAHQAPPSMEFSRQSIGVGCHFLLQRIFPMQGSNPGLPHCRQTLYRLSYQGSPGHPKTVICRDLFLPGLPHWFSSKEAACPSRRHRFDPWIGKVPCRRACQPRPVFLPAKSHGQRSQEGYSPYGCKEMDTHTYKDNIVPCGMQ